MFKNWEHAARYMQNVYGVYVDWGDRYFNCPECGEPIYEEDWKGEISWYECPICEFEW